MGCGCKKNGAAKTVSTPVVEAKPASSIQESKPQKKVGNRIIKREIR